MSPYLHSHDMRVVNRAYFIVFLFWFFFLTSSHFIQFFCLSLLVLVAFRISWVHVSHLSATFSFEWIRSRSMWRREFLFYSSIAAAAEVWWRNGIHAHFQTIISTHSLRVLHKRAKCVISHFARFFLLLPFRFASIRICSFIPLHNV